MSGKEYDGKLKAAKQKLESLVAELKAIKQSRSSPSLVTTATQKNKPTSTIREIECKRTFKAHGGDVTSVHWSGLDNVFVSCGKDAQIMIWDAFAKKRMQTIAHKTQWVMACAFERSSNRLVAAGGADKLCSIYMAGQIGMVRPSAELAGHDGYISSCSFIDENNILTASGDSRVIHWDIAQARAKVTFSDHAADCMSVSLAPQLNIFATGSADCTAKIWDVRSGSCTHTFSGHESDINAVEFFPDGNSIATASSDATCRVFDIRCYGQVSCFDTVDSQAGASSGIIYFSWCYVYVLQWVYRLRVVCSLQVLRMEIVESGTLRPQTKPQH